MLARRLKALLPVAPISSGLTRADRCTRRVDAKGERVRPALFCAPGTALLSSRLAGLPLLLALVLLAGCTPRLAPLYRDFSTEAADAAALDEAARALTATGWRLGEAPAPGMLATEPRRMSSWGLYRVYLSVEVLPLAGPYVRVLFHPYRQYVTGGRGSIPYLPSGVRRRAVPPLLEALRAQGFTPVLSGERAYRAQQEGTREE